MKIIKLSLQLFLLTVFLGCNQSFDVPNKKLDNTGNAKNQFLVQIETAIKSGKQENYQKLYNVDGLDNLMLQMIHSQYSELAQSQITKIEFIALDTDYKQEYVTDEERYTANLKAIGYVKINYLIPENKKDSYLSSLSVPYGIKDGKYALVGMVRKPIIEKSPKAVTISVSVNSKPLNIQQNFEGNCTYIKNNKSVSRNFEGSTPIAYAFWGERITHCEFQKLSAEGELIVTIVENGKIIFESSAKAKSEVVAYKPI